MAVRNQRALPSDRSTSASGRRGTPDFLFLFLTFLLVCFGFAFVFSASMALNANTPWPFAFKQAINITVGIFCMLVCMNIDYRKFQKWIKPLFISVVLLLLATPVIGASLNNARSWIKLGFFTLQPTELAKLMVILYLAGLLSRKGEGIRDFKTGFIPPLAVIGFISALIMLQPDFGSTAILCACALVMIFVGGARMRHMFLLGLVGACLASLFAAVYLLIGGEGNYRIDRFTTFLDPFSDANDKGYQIVQALYAFGHGGTFGAGFGQSIQKLHYLPLPYNDFIFPVIGEELGFIGTSIFLLVYLAFLWRGLIIALRSKETFGMLTGVGIISLIGIQAFINMGGVTNTIPMTGVTLPLISYGGTSIVVTLMSLGILLSISRDYNKTEKEKAAEKKKTPVFIGGR
ncbi:putative lipid II flippase FtsW [Paenibacillus doosanensis]|uniref:putative lipid II flippase FtsW n=1 Tax=Paenibacillus doosanensis TaxID=1229154 RepID=UPI0021805F1A|nr:putative lipid II flippase FtsW [Paenibacillus doosanensis]MCS7460816.1 putative lipid II flippase FtsW [Paenibacillus doosanensis]